MPRSRRPLAAAAAILLPATLLFGCSSPPPAVEPVTQVTASPEPSVEEKSQTTAPQSAEEVFTEIAKEIDTAKLVKVYTEDDDPNDLLGRPNGYTSKIAFSDSRVSKDDTVGEAKDAIERGGSIEVYPDDAGAKARATYIQEMLKATGFGTEYDYVKGPILVRVTGNLTPTKAKDYQAALA
jgi:hypothetical protein